MLEVSLERLLDCFIAREFIEKGKGFPILDTERWARS